MVALVSEWWEKWRWRHLSCLSFMDVCGWEGRHWQLTGRITIELEPVSALNRLSAETVS